MLDDNVSHERDILLVDLRNHGESDFHSSMKYSEMSDDLLRYLDSRGLEQVTLVGHNIGGKTAMTFAGQNPDRVKGLISFDTAPTGTAADKIQLTRNTIETIRGLNVEGKSKKGALEVIAQKFTDRGIANLISNNLAYTEDDNHQTVKWCVNLDSILSNLDSLCGFEPSQTKYEGPTFFLNGAMSVQYEDQVYKNEFPNAQISKI